MNDCDWWCDYSTEEAKKNYIKFVGKDTAEEFETKLPLQMTDKEMDTYKYSPDRGMEFITFKEELENRIKNNDVPSFFASTEY